MFANNFIIIFNGCLEPIKWRELCVIFCIAARAKSRKTVSFREELWLLRCRKVWVEVGWTFKIPDAFCICLCGHESNEISFITGIRTQCSACFVGEMAIKERRACCLCSCVVFEGKVTKDSILYE